MGNPRHNYIKPAPPPKPTVLMRPMILVTRQWPGGSLAVRLPVADFHRPDYINGLLRGSELQALADYVTAGDRVQLRRGQVVRFSDGSFTIRVTDSHGLAAEPYQGKPYSVPTEAEER